MQLPTPKTPVSKCAALGLYTQTMLAQFPANPALAALSTTIGAATSALTSAQTAYAEAVDGVNKGGKIASAVFPGGVTPIVRPVGATHPRRPG